VMLLAQPEPIALQTPEREVPINVLASYESF
jgi:hypothetical protein